MQLVELSNDEFSEFTNNYPIYSIYQTKEYGLITNHKFNSSFFIGIKNDYNNIIAASLICIKENNKLKYAYAPKGFLIDYNDNNLLTEFTKLIKNWLKKKGIVTLTISPLIWQAKYIFKGHNLITDINPQAGKIITTLKSLKYNHINSTSTFDAILNIDRNIVNSFVDIHKNYRTKIRSSDAKGIRIYKGNELQIPFMYEQLKYKYSYEQKDIENIYKYFSQSDMLDIHFAHLDPSLYLRHIQIKYQKQIVECRKRTDNVFSEKGRNNEKFIAKKIAADNELNNLKKQLVYATNLLRDYPNGIIIACAITIKYRNQVYLYLDSIDYKYKMFNARPLLIWKLIDKYTKENYKVFNLGNLISPLSNENIDKGLNHSKLSFGAEGLEYIGDFELIINPTIYAITKKKRN